MHRLDTVTGKIHCLQQKEEKDLTSNIYSTIALHNIYFKHNYRIQNLSSATIIYKNVL